MAFVWQVGGRITLATRATRQPLLLPWHTHHFLTHSISHCALRLGGTRSCWWKTGHRIGASNDRLRGLLRIYSQAMALALRLRRVISREHIRIELSSDSHPRFKSENAYFVESQVTPAQPRLARQPLATQARVERSSQFSFHPPQPASSSLLFHPENPPTCEARCASCA